MFKFQLPLREYSPRVKLPEYIIEKAEKMAPKLTQLGCYLDKLPWTNLTETEQQELIKIHFLGLKGECAFWSYYANNPDIAIDRNETALENTQPLQDANLFDAEIEIKTVGKKSGLEYVGLRVNCEKWNERKYDAYVLVYQQNIDQSKPMLSDFCVLGFATKKELENCLPRLDKNGKKYKWIHYHNLYPATDLYSWNDTEFLPTLKMVTYSRQRSH